MKRLATLAVLFVLAAPLASIHAQVGETPYYPLKVGNTWTYNGPGNMKLVTKVAAHEKVGEVMCAKLETTVDGVSKGTEHIGVTADGIYRYQLNGVKIDKPILILKLPPKKGDEWQINAKVGTDTVITGKMTTNEEDVTVPAGKYKAFVAGGRIDVGNQTMESYSYFVKDVGIAKIKMDLAGTPIVVELEKFEPAK